MRGAVLASNRVYRFRSFDQVYIINFGTRSPASTSPRASAPRPHSLRTGDAQGARGAAGYDDVPKNGLYVIGGLALGAGDIPLAALIRDLRISKQAAGQLVDTLVNRGYLARTIDAQDRRRLIVTLTDRGRAAAATQTAARERVDAELLAMVGAECIEHTRVALAALTEMAGWGEVPADDEA